MGRSLRVSIWNPSTLVASRRWDSEVRRMRPSARVSTILLSSRRRSSCGTQSNSMPRPGRMRGRPTKPSRFSRGRSATRINKCTRPLISTAPGLKQPMTSISSREGVTSSGDNMSFLDGLVTNLHARRYRPNTSKTRRGTQPSYRFALRTWRGRMLHCTGWQRCPRRRLRPGTCAPLEPNSMRSFSSVAKRITFSRSIFLVVNKRPPSLPTV